MTKQRAITISRPFDARHVGGVSVPGATIPIVGLERSSTTGLEPDEAPSHTYVATGNIEVPRRSNSIANTLSKPSLKLKTSISLLRGRSHSHSPEKTRKLESESTAESKGQSPQVDMSVQSLRKKSSSTRLWQRVHLETSSKDTRTTKTEAENKSQSSTPEKETPTLTHKPSVSRISRTISRSTYSSDYQIPPLITTTGGSFFERQFAPAPPQVQLVKKELPPVRPKRADSGTAIDFDDVPIQDRPMGFQEIMAVSGFEERMALYKKTREYWANVDHGLEEWVGRAGGPRRRLVSQI